MQIYNGWLVTVKHATRYFRLIFQITHKASPKWPYVPIPKAKQYDTIQYNTKRHRYRERHQDFIKRLLSEWSIVCNHNTLHGYYWSIGWSLFCIHFCASRVCAALTLMLTIPYIYSTIGRLNNPNQVWIKLRRHLQTLITIYQCTHRRYTWFPLKTPFIFAFQSSFDCLVARQRLCLYVCISVQAKCQCK